MTPPDLPLDDGPLDDDTLAVHAVVDDEATAEQRRRVARNPELVARVAALRGVVAAVAEPVAPPPADVLAAIRRRALDALGETEDRPDEDEVEDAPEPVVPPPPVRDLATARTRRTRSLPPLPAVAAVVVLLVVVGVGLLLAGTSGKGDSAADLSADAGGGQEATTGAGGGDDAAGESAPAAEDGGSADAARPADDDLDALLAQSTARYASQEDLEADLRRVDIGTLDLAGSPSDPSEQQNGDEEASTTTAPPSSTAQTADGDALAFATDPAVTRCDTVLRSAEPDLEPAVAAVLVDVEGVPVLVLSSPTEVSDQAPNGVRLTVLNAIDCSPRSAVLR